MPKEFRKLVFTTDELKAATFDYCLRNGVRIPRAPIDKLIVADGNDDFLTLCFSIPNSGDHEMVALSRDQVGAALIKYCSANGVPMPHQAKKILAADGGDVVMMVSMCQQTPKML